MSKSIAHCLLDQQINSFPSTPFDHQSTKINASSSSSSIAACCCKYFITHYHHTILHLPTRKQPPLNGNTSFTYSSSSGCFGYWSHFSEIYIFTEEIIRSGSAASLSSLLNRLDPVLREIANLGSWQIISPVEVVGYYVVVVDELLGVQNKSYGQPTVLVAKTVKGEEEIPDGTVAVLTPDMPDVLSHVCFATCFDPNIFPDLEAKQGKLIHLKPTSSDVVYSETREDALGSADSSKLIQGSLPLVTLTKKQFLGRYAISSDEFVPEMVGAKSRNIAYLKGKVPSWVGIPTSVALPFGVFEEVLSDNINKVVAEKLQALKKKLHEGDVNVLGDIRKSVLELGAPDELVKELKLKMQSAGMPWPGDESQERWEQAWTAIKN